MGNQGAESGSLPKLLVGHDLPQNDTTFPDQ